MGHSCTALHLVLHHAHAVAADVWPRNSTSCLEELALALLGVQLLLSQQLQHLAHVPLVLLQRLAVDEDVVEEHEHELVEVAAEGLCMRCMKVAGALVSPKGSTRNSKWP